MDQKIAELESQRQTNEKQETDLFGETAPWAPDGQGDLKKRLAEAARKEEQLQEALEAITRRQEEAVFASAGPPKGLPADGTDRNGAVRQRLER